MKSFSNALLLTFIVFSCVISCKKKPKDPDPGPAPVICNTPNSTLIKNDTILNISADTAYATLNNTFYTEHTIAAAHGCSIEFSGSTSPPEGTYSITPIFNEVVPGSKKVYVQYYELNKTFFAQSGNVTITGSGSTATIEFCKIYFKDSFGEEKTISIKTDSE